MDFILFVVTTSLFIIPLFICIYLYVDNIRSINNINNINNIKKQYKESVRRTDELEKIGIIINDMISIIDYLKGIDMAKLNKKQLLAYSEIVNNSYRKLTEHKDYDSGKVEVYEETLSWMVERYKLLDPNEIIKKREDIINDILE